MAESTSELALPPVEQLRIVREILSDPDMEYAERVAAAAVALMAGKEDRLAWASYGALRDEFGVGNDTILAVLRSAMDGKPQGKAVGKYLAFHGRGRHGSACYRVLRSTERSVEPSALRSSGPIAPFHRPQRSAERRQTNTNTNSSTNPKEIPPADTGEELSGSPTPAQIHSVRPRWSSGDVERIYRAYPRKVGRPVAMKAIAKALAVVADRTGAPQDAAAWLLGKVQAFAESAAGRAGVYTPHPATFFNQGRYDDDPGEWNRDGGSGNGERSLARIVAQPGKYANVGHKVRGIQVRGFRGGPASA